MLNKRCAIRFRRVRNSVAITRDGHMDSIHVLIYKNHKLNQLALTPQNDGGNVLP